MKEIVEDKGRIRPIVEGDFQCDENGNSTKYYEILSIVGTIKDNGAKVAYISKKDAPIGTSITDEEYWYPFQVIAVPKGDKGDDGKSAYDLYLEHGGTITPVEAWLESLQGKDGKDGQSPILRVSSNGQDLEISSDGGETWYTFQKDFNKIRVIGFVDSTQQLPISAQIGDIYGVWDAQPTEEEPEAGVYKLYINTVKGWNLNYTITKVYDYDTELPSSAADGTTVLVPVDYLTLDKQKIDGYKVYRFDASKHGWTMILDTAEIYASKEDIVNYGDNVFALVQGEEEHTYDLYQREVDWVYFGTNASITYHLVQNVNDGTEQNVLSGKAVKDCCEEVDGKLKLLAKGVKVELTVSPSTIYKNTATQVTLMGEMIKATPSEMKIINGSDIQTSSNNPFVYSPSIIIENDSKNINLEGTVQGMTFTDEKSINARYPIYYGFGENAESVAIAANKYSATTSARNTYTKTNNADGQRFYILVPNDISDVSNFTMGGAPFVMNAVTTQTINDIEYKVHESGNVYNSGVTLKVSAT